MSEQQLITGPANQIQLLLIEEMEKELPHGRITMDYPHLGVERGYDDDGNAVWFANKDLNKKDFPAAVIHSEADDAKNLWIGAFVGSDGTRAQLCSVLIVFDVWGENAPQRDDMCNFIDNFLLKHRWNFKRRGIVDIQKFGSSHRGFDLTDKILFSRPQYESHSIIHIRRKFVTYVAEFEHVVPTIGEAVSTIDRITSSIYGETMVIGKLQLPQVLLEDLMEHNLV